MALRATPRALARLSTRVMQLGEPGSGSGKSGGSGGSIRDAGGAFGKLEAARESEYFHKLQQRQINELRRQLQEEVKNAEHQVSQQKQVLQRHKERLAELEDFEKKTQP